MIGYDIVIHDKSENVKGINMRFDYKHDVMIAGHRGDPKHYPENTMQSFKSALQKGADMIETDIRLSKDGIPVLIHDETVDRTTNGTGRVGDKTYLELYGLNAGSSADAQHIPTLEEFLEYMTQEDLLLNLEIKEYYDGTNAEFCQNAIDKIVGLVEKYNLSSKCVFNSFDAFALEYLHKQYNGKYRLHGFYPYNIMRNVSMNPDEYLYCACVFEHKNIENYKHLIDNKIEVWLGAGIKDKEDFKLAVESGGNLFTSDNPGTAIQILEELGFR